MTLYQEIRKLDEMDKFLKKHKLPKLTRKEINSLNSPKSIKEIKFELLVKNILHKTKPPGPYGFNRNSANHLPILQKWLQNI